MKLFRALASVSVVLCLVTPPCLSQSPQQNARDACVRLYRRKTAGDPSTNVLTGTAFFVQRNGVLVSAYHNVQGASQIVLGKPWSNVEARVIAYDEKRDLVALAVNLRGMRCAWLDCADVPKDNDERSAFAIGNPDGKHDFKVDISFPTKNLIDCQKFRGDRNRAIFLKSAELEILPISGIINPGMSGGPVVLDGKAIAVISGGQAASGGNHGWAIPLLPWLSEIADSIGGKEPFRNKTFATKSLPPAQYY